MADVLEADLVYETSTGTGTGTLNLAGRVGYFRSFVSGYGSTNLCYYAIRHQTADEWEVGVGVVTSGSPDTLTRQTVLSSSNSGSIVNFSAGVKNVQGVRPANLFTITSRNPTFGDADGDRKCRFIAKGYQSGGEESTLGEWEFSHDGASDDQKGKFILRLNNGNDGTSPTDVITALSNGYVGIGATPNARCTISNTSGSADETILDICNNRNTANDVWGIGFRNPTFGYEARITCINRNDGGPYADLHLQSSNLSGLTAGIYLDYLSNVGIGTPAPNDKLEVAGAFNLQGTNSGATIPALGTNAGRFKFLNGNLYGLLGDILTNGNTYLQSGRIDGDTTAYNLLLNPLGGNVGIGGTPGSKFQVIGSYSDTINYNADTAIASFSGSGSYSMLQIGAYASSLYDTWIQCTNGINGFTPLAINPSGGNVGVGCRPATSFDIAGDSVRVRTSQTPASNGAGVQGEWAWDENYFYVCSATNTWKRAALTGGY